MRKTVGVVAFAIAVVFATASVAAAYVYSSNNDFNRTHHGPYVDAKTAGNKVDITFVNPNPYYACFEYRTNGDTSQQIGSPNFNLGVADQYPYVCLPGIGSKTMTFKFVQYVEIRSVFGS